MKVRELNWPIIVIVMFILLFFGSVYLLFVKCGILEEVRSLFISLSSGKPF